MAETLSRFLFIEFLSSSVSIEDIDCVSGTCEDDRNWSTGGRRRRKGKRGGSEVCESGEGRRRGEGKKLEEGTGSRGGSGVGGRR